MMSGVHVARLLLDVYINIHNTTASHKAGLTYSCSSCLFFQQQAKSCAMSRHSCNPSKCFISLTQFTIMVDTELYDELTVCVTLLKSTIFSVSLELHMIINYPDLCEDNRHLNEFRTGLRTTVVVLGSPVGTVLMTPSVKYTSVFFYVLFLLSARCS